MGEVGHAGVLLVCLGLLHAFASLDKGTGHERGDETERPDCIIVCWNLVVDLVRVAVGVDDGDHRNTKHMCFLDGAMLLVGIDDIDGTGKTFHGTKTAEQLAQASLGLHGLRAFLDSHGLDNTIGFFAVDLLQAVDALADCDVVGHETADPALVNIPGCLLYTSDAADDLLCVDLGGRRIIKKKKKTEKQQKRKNIKK